MRLLLYELFGATILNRAHSWRLHTPDVEELLSGKARTVTTLPDLSL